MGAAKTAAQGQAAQVVQPGSVVWSFLLLGETLRGGQFVGIAIALERAARLHRDQPARRTAPDEGTGRATDGE